MTYTITVDQHNAMMSFEELCHAIRHGAHATISIDMPSTYTSSVVFEPCHETEQQQLLQLESTAGLLSHLQSIGK